LPTNFCDFMDLRSGCPYWLVKNGLPYTYPTLEHNLTSDVAVVGGGVSGALIAWHLAAAGLQTVLLDRREIGWGSTAASTALLQYEIDTPMVKLAEA
ncbi:FAD-dependent oxidoreductase, partial [Pseudomonas shirazica]|uniref:FAD-dependent oxidoreductase n=1 Tax=Pseudomonas shirazica TaxID=1940636 RepID=UPI003AB07B55